MTATSQKNDIAIKRDQCSKAAPLSTRASKLGTTKAIPQTINSPGASQYNGLRNALYCHPEEAFVPAFAPL